jgi:hypothetical protein
MSAWPAEGSRVTLDLRGGPRTLVVRRSAVSEEGRTYLIACGPGMTVLLYADAFRRGRLP